MVATSLPLADTLHVGQIKYSSVISKQEEYLPIVASFVGAPGEIYHLLQPRKPMYADRPGAIGADLALVRLGAEVLKKAGLRTVVDTGRSMFPP